MARGRPTADDGGTRRRRRLRREPYVWPADGPRPGDPRSDGPRPRGTFRDGFWIALTGALIVVTVLQLIRLVWTLVTSDQVRISGGGAFLGFLVTVVWLLTIFWLAAGAWRRSVWGCPFEHTESAGFDRRCRRHALLPGDDQARVPTEAAPDPPRSALWAPRPVAAHAGALVPSSARPAPPSGSCCAGSRHLPWPRHLRRTVRHPRERPCALERRTPTSETSRDAPMANIKSQIKRNRQNEARHERNKAVRSKLKTFTSRFRTAARPRVTRTRPRPPSPTPRGRSTRPPRRVSSTGTRRPTASRAWPSRCRSSERPHDRRARPARHDLQRGRPAGRPRCVPARHRRLTPPSVRSTRPAAHDHAPSLASRVTGRPSRAATWQPASEPSLTRVARRGRCCSDRGRPGAPRAGRRHRPRGPAPRARRRARPLRHRLPSPQPRRRRGPARPRRGAVAVAVLPPDPGRTHVGAVVQLAADDRPFLLSTVLDEIERRGRRVTHQLHPIVGRDP